MGRLVVRYPASVSGGPDVASGMRTRAACDQRVAGGTRLAKCCCMLSTISSCSLYGVEAYSVVVEVSVSSGLPNYHVVGLPAPAVKEGSVRIECALAKVGQALPNKKVTVNLAPAGRRKQLFSILRLRLRAQARARASATAAAEKCGILMFLVVCRDSLETISSF